VLPEVPVTCHCGAKHCGKGDGVAAAAGGVGGDDSGGGGVKP